MKKVTSDNFEEVIEEGTVVIDFWAPWCGPCKAIKPKVKKLNENLEDVTFGGLNVDENPEVAQEHQIKSIPTFIVFEDGEKSETVTTSSIDTLKDVISNI